MSGEFPWKICVITNENHEAKREVANACLYGDEVLVITTRGLLNFIESAISNYVLKSGFKTDKYDVEKKYEESNNRYEDYHSILMSIEESGAKLILPNFIKPPEEWLPQNVPDDDDEWLNIAYKSWATGLIDDGIRITQACITHAPMNDWLGVKGGWCPHSASQSLIEAMSSLHLLPDVSGVPLAEILEMKEKLKDNFEPMRAELLRMTKELRSMVDENISNKELVEEAKILISTQVEPVVRESSRYTNELIKKKYTNFLVKVPKALGLIGLGFLNPSVFAEKATSEVLDMSNRLSETLDKPQQPLATARFILEMKKVNAK